MNHPALPLLLLVLILLCPGQLDAQDDPYHPAADTSLLLLGQSADSITGGPPSVVTRFAAPIDEDPYASIVVVDPIRSATLLNLGYYRLVGDRIAVGGEFGLRHALFSDEAGPFGDDWALLLGGMYLLEESGFDGFFLQGSVYHFSGNSNSGLDFSFTSIIVDGGLMMIRDIPLFPGWHQSMRAGFEYVVAGSSDIETHADSQVRSFGEGLGDEEFRFVSGDYPTSGSLMPHFSIALYFPF